MAKGLLFISILLILIGNCTIPQSRTKTTDQRYEMTKTKIQNGEITYGGGDGLTVSNAIKIFGVNTPIESIPAEYLWLADRHGNRGTDWQLVNQSLIKENNQYFDYLEIELSSNKEKIGYYFETSLMIIK